MVPPVPTPATKASHSARPASSSWATISGPVVRRWASTLAGFLNCWGITKSGFSAHSCTARSTAPRMTSAAGVRITSAP